MTDTMPEQTTDESEDWSDVESSANGVTYPEHGPLPEARFSVNFTPGRPPQLTVRGHTAADVTAALQELEEANAFNVIGVVHSTLGAQVAIGAGLGPATPVPAGAPAAPQAPGVPTPPPFGPNVSVPQAPGFQGNPGFPPPPAAPAVQNNAPEFQQNGWYRLTVPFPKKGQFDGIVQQYQMRKGRPTEGGSVSFNKADKSWYVSPQYAGAFGDFSPVPA